MGKTAGTWWSGLLGREQNISEGTCILIKTELVVFIARASVGRRIKRTQRHSRGGPWTVPVVNVVSRGVDAPPGLRGVGDLCRLGDQMLNIPPRQLRTGARHMKRNIIRRAIPSVRVLHRAKPQRKHFNSVWYWDVEPCGELTTDWMTVLWSKRLSIRHACNSLRNASFYWMVKPPWCDEDFAIAPLRKLMFY